MSFSRTRPPALQQHRHAGGSDGVGAGPFYNFRSIAFPNPVEGDVNAGKYAVNGGHFTFAGGYGRDLRQPQRRHAAPDDFAAAPPLKRRRSALDDADGRGGCWRSGAVVPCGDAPSTSDSSFLHSVVAAARHSGSYLAILYDCGVPSTRGQALLEEDDMVLMSRDEIERCSPSRKDGIDLVRETHLRYSYCAFLQNLGMRLDLPQTTTGTAVVLCHRFFVRRSHACHDRFLIATSALFLAAKSEETPCPLNTVIRASCEICHKQDSAFLSYLLPVETKRYLQKFWNRSEDLRIALEQVEDAFKGKESAIGDNGCLSKGDVKDILTKVENFMETQACDTAKKIGVSFDGVDKGLKSLMLLIKRRLLADMARKAKADVAGKANSEES